MARASDEAVFGRTFLVSGPESLLAERAVVELRSRALVEMPDAQVNVVEAPLLEGSQLAEMTGGSLFSSSSFAVINDLANLPAELTDAVAALAASTPEDVCLVLVHGGGVKGKALLDKVKKAKAEVIAVEAVKPHAVPQFVTAEARRLGVRLDPGAGQLLVEAVGPDLRALSAALAQLAADTEGQTLTEAQVKRYFAGRAEVSSFAIADAVIAGQRAEALEKLRWALETGTAAVLVTSALAGSLRHLGKYLDARGRRLREGEMAAAVGCPPWKLKSLAAQSRSWDEARVARGLALVATADADVKGASGSPDFVLEKLVLQLSARPRS